MLTTELEKWIKRFYPKRQLYDFDVKIGDKVILKDFNDVYDDKDGELITNEYFLRAAKRIFRPNAEYIVSDVSMDNFIINFEGSLVSITKRAIKDVVSNEHYDDKDLGTMLSDYKIKEESW